MSVINGYQLSRSWFDFCFENQDIINPTHTAMYLWFIELNNRMGWVEKFASPASQTMAATGVKSYNTYKKIFNDLVGWGFVDVIKKSENQYQACIIALSKFDKSLDKSLDKSVMNHLTNQSDITCHITRQITDSINKPINNKQLNQETTNQETIEFVSEKSETDIVPSKKIDFEIVWNLYDKKVGDKTKLKKKWDALKLDDQQKIIDHVPKYKISQPDKIYRKNFETFLNNKSWNDEIITPSTNVATTGANRKSVDDKRAERKDFANVSENVLAAIAAKHGY